MNNVIKLPAREHGDAFTVKKLKWIEAVTLDRDISAEAARLATVLAVKFLSRRSGCAFPSQMTLADILGITDRQVRRHTSTLVDAGYIVRRNRGNNRVNEYRIAFPTGHSASGGTKRDRTSEGRPTGHPTSGPGPDIPRPPNPMREPYDEPYEGRPLAAEPYDRCSTLDGSRDALPSASQPSDKGSAPIFRVGDWRINSRGEGYAVLDVDEDARTVTVRFENGREKTMRAPAGAVLIPGDGDLDDEAPCD